MPKYFGGGGGGVGAVSSVFGRIGAVIAALGDYAASLVTNDSNVAGITVAEALNTLNILTPTPITTNPANPVTTQTLTVVAGNRVVITGPLTADITLTLGTLGAGANEGYLIERRDTTAFQVTVINGGPAGAGGPAGGPNLYVFPGSVARSSSFLFDAADWSQGINLSISP